MPRTLGWKDQNVTGGFNKKNEDQKFKVKKGERYIIRVLTECVEFREHKVDDVLEPDPKTNEERAFAITCRKDFDDKSGEWTGDCQGCDERNYDVSSKYVAGIVLVGLIRGRNPNVQKIDAPNSVYYWPFGADKYRKLSDIELSLNRGKKTLKDVELEVSLDNSDGAETYQKVNLVIAQGEQLTTKAHILAFKDEGPKLVEDCWKAPSEQEMKRSLKKRGKQKQEDDGSQDLGLSDGEEPAAEGEPSDAEEAPAEEAPAPKPKGVAKKVSSAAPAKATTATAKKPATKVAPKAEEPTEEETPAEEEAPAEGEAESSGDGDIDGLLDTL